MIEFLYKNKVKKASITPLLHHDNGDETNKRWKGKEWTTFSNSSSFRFPWRKPAFWPPPSHQISIPFISSSRLFRSRNSILYFLISLFDIFYASRVFSPTVSVSLMMLSLWRISFMPLFLRFDWVFGIRKLFFSSLERKKKFKNSFRYIFLAASTGNKILVLH